MTRVLRLMALAIAIAGVVDPAITVSGSTRPRIAVVKTQPSSPAADDVETRLTRDLSASYEIVAGLTSDAAAAIVVGDRYPDEQLPESLLAATVTSMPAVAPGAAIVRIDAPREVLQASAIHLDVEVAANGMADQTTDVVATLAGLEVGRASHRWTEGDQRWRAGIDAVPVGEPPYVLKVRLKPDTTGISVVSGFSRTIADVVVDLRREPIRVEFYDPRPSWATTFLRRALEGDARFRVAALSFTSRGVSVETGGAVPLGDPRLDGFEVVVVGALDRLSVADVTALQRFVRERGGAVVVVPDQRIEAGPARDLLGTPDLVERLLEQPATLSSAAAAPSLRASELLVFRAPPPGSDVVARVPGDAAPVVVSAPRGDGRLLVSGAMDAWRFRAEDNQAFDRFWQATIAGLGLAVPPPIAIAFDPPLLRPGETADVTVRIRSRDVTGVSALLDGDQPVRLLPEPETGVYRGRFVAKTAPGQSRLDVRARSDSPSASPGLRTRTVLVRSDAQRLRPVATPSLALLVSSHRGVDVTPDRLPELERFLRSAVSAPRVPQTRHPMRSTWWILPFALCLSAEWWLRRRRGLR